MLPRDEALKLSFPSHVTHPPFPLSRNNTPPTQFQIASLLQILSSIFISFYAIYNKVSNLIIPSREVEGAKVSSQIAGLRKQIDKTVKKIVSGESVSSSSKSLESPSASGLQVDNLDKTLSTIISHLTSLESSLSHFSKQTKSFVETLPSKIEASSIGIENKIFELLTPLVDIRSAIQKEKEFIRTIGKVLQESVFAVSMVNRTHVCIAELHLYKQLRYCMETGCTPAELQLYSQNESFLPENFDMHRASNLNSINEETLFGGEYSHNDVALGDKDVRRAAITLAGVEAILFDEDGTGICCGEGRCEGECSKFVLSRLSSPIMQLIRANIPGTLQEMRKTEACCLRNKTGSHHKAGENSDYGSHADFPSNSNYIAI